VGERRRDKRQLKATKAGTKQATNATRQAATAAYWEQQQNATLIAQQQQQLELMRAQLSAAQATTDAQGGRWAPDPYGRFHTRYWDGEKWTQWVGDRDGGQSSDPVS
jgi:hypothetical protein